MAEQAVEYMSLEFREKICDRNKTLGVDSLLTLFKAIISHYTYLKLYLIQLSVKEIIMT